MTKPLLDIQNLNIWYRVFEGNLKVLNGVNLKIWPGERVGLVGEMGCGKTTTMKAIMNLLSVPPAIIKKGCILFEGKDVLKMKKNELRRIRRENFSMIFEDSMAALNPVFTIGTQIKDAIRFSGNLDGNSNKKKLYECAIRALEDVSLPDPERILGNYPIQLSGGMRQRICIAMALLSADALLIADEPDTALDVTIKDQVLRLLNELVRKKGTSTILVSHSLGAVRKMTDRVYVMYAGTILESGVTKMIFDEPKHPYSQLLIESVPRLTGSGIGPGILGRIPEYINPPKGCRFHPRCEKAMPICKTEKPSVVTLAQGHDVACHLYG